MDTAFYLNVISPYLNLALFLFLAVKFLKKPLSSFFLGKRTRFQDELQAAGAHKDKALKENNILEKKLKEIDVEIAAIKKKAETSADYEYAQITTRAQELADNLRAEATRIRETEVKKAKEELKKQIVSEVKGVVVEKITTELGSDKKSEFVKSNINSLKSIKGGKN